MKAEQLVNSAMETAALVLEQSGKVPGVVLLHAKGKGITALPYKNGTLPVDVEQFIIVEGVKAVRELGAFDGVVIVAEAWMAVQNKEEMLGIIRPAQDPDRKEIVMAFAYGEDGSKKMAMADIIRTGDRASLGPVDDTMSGVESWLDEAFKD